MQLDALCVEVHYSELTCTDRHASKAAGEDVERARCSPVKKAKRVWGHLRNEGQAERGMAA